MRENPVVSRSVGAETVEQVPQVEQSAAEGREMVTERKEAMKDVVLSLEEAIEIISASDMCDLVTSHANPFDDGGMLTFDHVRILNENLEFVKQGDDLCKIMLRISSITSITEKVSLSYLSSNLTFIDGDKVLTPPRYIDFELVNGKGWRVTLHSYK